MRNYRHLLTCYALVCGLSYSTILLLAYLGQINGRTVLAFVLATTAALIPSPLLAAVVHKRLTKTAAHNDTERVLFYAVTSGLFELLLLFVSLLISASYHLAPAVTALHIVMLDVLGLILPITALRWDAKRAHSYALSRQTVLRIASSGLALAVLCYAAYVLEFTRHHLDPRYIDSSLPVYHQATNLVLVTLVFGLYVHMLFERAHTHELFFSNHLRSNHRLLIAFGLSLLLIVVFVYSPLSGGQLDIIDWLIALVTASLYAGVRLVQRYTRAHSRQAVIGLVHELHRAQR